MLRTASLIALTTFALVCPALADKPVYNAGDLIQALSDDPGSSQFQNQIFDVVGKIRSIKITEAKGQQAAVGFVDIGSAKGGDKCLALEFASYMLDDVRKMKVGDKLQVEVSYENEGHFEDKIENFNARIVVSYGPYDDPVAAQFRQQLIDWVVKNNSLDPGPDNQLVKDTTAQIDENLPTGQDFCITFGAGLMNSGHVTVLSVQDGTMLVSEFDDAQTAASSMPKMSTAVQNANSQVTVDKPEAVIQPPVFPNNQWDLTKPFTGTLQIKWAPNFPTETSANYAIRAVTQAGDGRFELFDNFLAPPYDGEAQIEYGVQEKATPLRTAGVSGPHIVYFELVRMHKNADGDNVDEIISAPVAVVVNVIGNDKPN